MKNNSQVLIPRLLSNASANEIWNAFLSWSNQAIPLNNNATLSFSYLQNSPEYNSLGFELRRERGPTICLAPLEFPFEAMFGVSLSIQDVQTLPEIPRDAINKSVMQFIWDALPANLAGRLMIAASGTLGELPMIAGNSNHDPDAFAWFACELYGISPSPIVFHVGAERNALIDWLTCGDIKLDPFLSNAVAAHINTDVYFSIGKLCLSFGDLRKISLGQVVVLEEIEADAILARIDWTGYKFRCQNPETRNWVCVKRETTERYRIRSTEDED